MDYYYYCHLFIYLFFICHQHQTISGKIKTNKTQQTLFKTQVFFLKTELRHI